MSNTNLIYSNARMRAEFDDWPYGRQQRTKCTFEVTSKGNGKERCEKTTINPKTGQYNNPKLGVYAPRVRIMDGSDGKTYIVSFTAYGDFHVMDSALKYHIETVRQPDPRFRILAAEFLD